MTRPSPRTLLTVFLLFSLLFLCAFLPFPVKDILLTATFGETRGDHLHNGIDLGKGDQDVFPIAKGEIIYYIDRNEHPLIQVFGNGNLAVMQHDKSSDRSYYYHLKTGSLDQFAKRAAGPDDRIGISGNSGRSFGAHLHLSYSKNGVFVNPLKYLPEIRDTIAPKIISIIFIVGKRELTIPATHRLTGVDDFTFAVRAYDQNPATRRIASVGIYRVAFYIDDRKIKEYRFDSMQTVNGRARLNGKIPFEELYHKGLYLGGRYRNIIGTHVFRVRLWDTSGNTTTKSVKVNFR